MKFEIAAGDFQDNTEIFMVIHYITLNYHFEFYLTLIISSTVLS